MTGKILRLEITPLEALSFRYSGEFSPVARGPAVLGQTLLTPLPSTLLGALSYIACTTMSRTTNGSILENYKVICNFMKTTDVYIRGPYLIINDNIYLLLDNLLIKLPDKINENTVRTYIRLKIAELESMKEKVNELRRLFDKMIAPVQFLGIGLKPEVKVVYREAPGLLYLAEFVDYLSLLSERVGKSIVNSVSINYDIVLRDSSITTNQLNEIASKIGNTIRFGGESRMAKFRFDENLTLINVVKKIIVSEAEYYWLLVVSPIILDPPPTRSTIPPLSVEEIADELGDMIVEVKAFIGKLISLGLGFKEVEPRRRRALKIAIPPGSLILAKMKNPVEILVEGVGRSKCEEIECRRIGYGTVIPVPATNYELRELGVC